MYTPRFIRQLLPQATNEPAQKKLIFSSPENRAIIDGFINDESHITGMNGSQVIEAILIEHYIPHNRSLARVAAMVYEDISNGLFQAAAQLFNEIGSDPRTLNSACDYLPVIKSTLPALSRTAIDQDNTSYKEFVYFFDLLIDALKNNVENNNPFPNNRSAKDQIEHLALMQNSVDGGHLAPAPIVRFVIGEWDVLHNREYTYYCLNYLYSSLAIRNCIYPQDRVEFIEHLFTIEDIWDKEKEEKEKYQKKVEEYAKQTEQMVKYDIADGYVTVPANWIVANPRDALNCRYVGVVEVKNGHLFNKPYGAPHILFFSKIPINQISETDRNRLFARCISCWPDFIRVLDMQIEPEYDSSGRMTNSDKWSEAPKADIFPILESTEYYYSAKPPFGATIIRTKQKEKGEFNE